MAQFMAEAGLIAAAGGFTGVAAGLGMCGLVAASGDLPPYFSPLLATGIFMLSGGCGVLGGTYPAVAAARTDVLKALRDM
jgi:ABC-type antimicrobial peptide transport system permease subunit